MLKQQHLWSVLLCYPLCPATNISSQPHCLRSLLVHVSCCQYAFAMTAMTQHVCCAQQLICVVQVRPAYLVLDAFHHGQVESHMSVTKIMADSEYLRECQDLFELYVSDYIMLTRCKVRLRLLSMHPIRTCNCHPEHIVLAWAGVCKCVLQAATAFTNMLFC